MKCVFFVSDLKRFRGFTLVELLIGFALFSLLLTMLAIGMQVSHKTLLLSDQATALNFRLQTALDDTVRMVRQAVNVTYYHQPIKSSQVGLILTEPDGSSVILSFSNGTLYDNGSPIADNLQSIDFKIKDSGVVKNVMITMTADTENASGAALTKTLISSVSLRNVPPGAAISLGSSNASPGGSSVNSSGSSLPLHCITGHIAVCCTYTECYNSSGKLVSGYYFGICSGPALGLCLTQQGAGAGGNRP